MLPYLFGADSVSYPPLPDACSDTENMDLFDKEVDLTYENEQLRSKIQVLQDKLEKAYEFMKQFVINGRNMLDVFRERIGEVKEWVHRKVAGMGW